MQIRNIISQIITSHLALQQQKSSSSCHHHHHDDVVANFLQPLSTKDTTKINSSISRRFLLRNCIAATVTTTAVSTTTTTTVNAAETIGKDPNCIDKSCLGVWDGLLADCPHGGNILLKGGGVGAGCTSSQDDTPGIFSEPWDYSEAPNQSLDWEEQMRLLLPTIQLVCGKRGDQVRVLLNEGRYLRVVFTDGKTSEKSVGEFYATPNDTTIQFRLGSLNENNNNGGGGSRPVVGSLRNIERAEMIRKQLKYTKLPVLRNRKRTLFFVESDFDTFGPGSAALGPPAEMKTGEIDGRIDVDPKLNKVDILQQFPIAK